ncbi:MAG: 6-pyruvoyl-tetrahydropterin synthase-related protein, partial [Chloroflexi bacterium]|nr:6-pyruvoyl-tetrahydropterin synthase-related protein [Chloroflexota bacterium]
RTFELSTSIGDGALPGRWMPDAAFGLGYPFFVYYAALPYYLAAVVAMTGLSVVSAIKITQTLGVIAAAAGMYGFARKWLPSHGAALAAVAYTTAPFHLANVYVRGDSLSEFWAFVWFPLILWTLSERPQQPGNRITLVLPALPLAALVLTHNVSALLFAPFIVAWLLPDLASLLRTPRALLRHIVELAIPALLAIALSAWFWLPALGESAQAQLSEQTSGYFNFANHFRTFDFCAPSTLQNSCPERPIDQIPLVQTTLFADAAPPHAFAMGLLQTLATLVGAVLWLRRDSSEKTRRPLRVPLLFAGATLMITVLSEPIWRASPLLQLAQFPWRMLSVQALFGSLLIGAIGARASKASATAAAGVCLLLIASIVPLTTRIESLHISQDDLNPRTLQLFEWYSGIIGTTIRAEYLPATVQPVPAIGPDLLGQPRRALIAQDGIPSDALDSQLLTIETDAQVWRIDVHTDKLTMALPLLYSPAWEAIDLDNGAGVPLAAYHGSGWVQLELPRGRHHIMLRYAGTVLQRTAQNASLIAFAITTLLLLSALPRMPREAVRRSGLVALTFIVAIAVPIFAERLIHRRAVVPPSGDFVDFAQQPFVHRGGMTLTHDDSHAELVGAVVEPSTLRAGELFTLTLQWRTDTIAPLELVQELPSSSERFDLFKHSRERSPVQSIVSTHIAPRDALPGPLLLMLVPVEGWSVNRNEANVAGKTGPGVTLIGPIVYDTPINIPTEITARFANGIRAHSIDWLQPDGERICFRARWSRNGAVNRADALNVSFKLFGSDGRLIAQADGQPQQGLAPTWSWLDDVVVADSRCVHVIDPQHSLSDREKYRLEITWYRLFDMQSTGQAVLHGRADAAEGAVNVVEAQP